MPLKGCGKNNIARNWNDPRFIYGVIITKQVFTWNFRKKNLCRLIKYI